MKKLFTIILMFCLLLLCSCSLNETTNTNADLINSVPSQIENGKTNNVKDVNDSVPSQIKDEKTAYIKQILYRYIDGVNLLEENADVKITGPITKEGSFYKLFVDTIPENGWGLNNEIRFYIPEPDVVEKSFSVTFPKDYSMKSLRDFIALTIYATDNNISYENAEAEMNKLIANYSNDSPSNIYECDEYYVYLAPANIVSGYTVEAVHKSESNTPINKLDYKQVEYSVMASELNKGVNCYITATPYDIILAYPNAYIKVKDLQGNLYYITATYNDVLNNLEKGEQYVFYFALAGKVIDNEIYCGLRYFEHS